MGNNIIYVFVSHSHKDLHAVRLIRNYLEQKGAEPILFFLKSLSDKDEITGLIKREIDARIWFIYCKSKNSEESKWVKSELNYVHKQSKENVLTIDLDFCLDTKNELNDATKNLIDHALFKMIKLSRIYASYSPRDREIFFKISEYLRKYNLKVVDYSMISVGEGFEEYILDKIANSKYFLIFFSSNSISNKSLKLESRYARNFKRIFIPVILYESDLDKKCIYDKICSDYEYEKIIKKNGHFDFDVSNIKSSCNELILYLFNKIGD